MRTGGPSSIEAWVRMSYRNLREGGREGGREERREGVV
jgi:hypothetical protein